MFLTFVISWIKDFIFNGSDPLELWIYILNIKSTWFCTKNSFESPLRKPKTEWIPFQRINLVNSIDLELYCICKIDRVLSHQKVCRKDNKVTSIFET